MHDAEPNPPQEASLESVPETPSPVGERFRELAELEVEIRRRLRSNQRFLESFLDEDFVDDEADEEDDKAAGGEEEL
jgi:hypothetical protein